MSQSKKDEILHDHNHDGIDRRGFLKCMAWAGTGALCVMQGGVLKSYSMSRMNEWNAAKTGGELSFAQISDSHMGFNKPANPDVAGTLKAAVDKINALSVQPEFLLHTGDISHLAKPEEFDTVDQILKGAVAKEVFFVPGEHDVIGDDGQQYRDRYGKGTKGAGWYSFDKKGVHFIGLVNVVNLKAGGLGNLGGDQLDWLAADVKQFEIEHSDCGVRAHSVVVGISRMGMGDGRQRAGFELSAEIWIRVGVERAHPPDHAEGGGECDVSHGDVHGISSAAAGEGGFAGADESAGGAVAECVGDYGCELRARAACIGDCGFAVGVKFRRSAHCAAFISN